VDGEYRDAVPRHRGTLNATIRSPGAASSLLAPRADKWFRHRARIVCGLPRPWPILRLAAAGPRFLRLVFFSVDHHQHDFEERLLRSSASFTERFAGWRHGESSQPVRLERTSPFFSAPAAALYPARSVSPRRLPECLTHTSQLSRTVQQLVVANPNGDAVSLDAAFATN